jgi:pimeloyl-ACP methyl ester carboxylesterase
VTERPSSDLLRVVERSGEVAGLRTLWLEAVTTGDGHAPASIVYLHGNPVASWIWERFLERTGGIAPDLPGFGRSAKPDGFNYSLSGYADFLERFVQERELERFSLVLHDIGALTGLVFAQRIPERLERVVIANHAPLLPGYRWHRFARIWRTPVLGELFMATTTGFAFKRSLRPSNVRGLPDEFIARAWADFDRETRRAILRLYRSMPESVLAREGRNLGRIRCPALVVWSTEDPYIGPEYGRAYAAVLGGDAKLENYEDAGHWLWLDRPEVIDSVVEFLKPAR